MQPHQRAQRDALARAGFADQRQRPRRAPATRSTPSTARTLRRPNVTREVPDRRRRAAGGVMPRPAGGGRERMPGARLPPSGRPPRCAARERGERRLRRRADRLGERAARVEAAAGRRVDRVRRIARERRFLGPVVRVDRRHRGRAAPPCRGGAARSKTSSDGPISATWPRYITITRSRDEAHDVEVVADEDVGEAELVLEVEQQVQHLRLDRLVERRDRLVEDHQARLERERAGDVDALALAARQLVRIAAGEARRARARRGAAGRAPARSPARVDTPCTCGPKATESSMVRRGLSEA